MFNLLVLLCKNIFANLLYFLLKGSLHLCDLLPELFRVIYFIMLFNERNNLVFIMRLAIK